MESGEGIESRSAGTPVAEPQRRVESGEGIERDHPRLRRSARASRPWNPVKELKGHGARRLRGPSLL